MQFSPATRAILTAVVAMLAALAVTLPTLGAPVWVGVIVGVLNAGFGALGILPPQTGGTQVGVVSPTVVEPPAADVVEAVDTAL